MEAAPLRQAGRASGEGERTAQRGYVRQYDLAARVIYDALAAGHLRWVGLADRSAGAFDDVVLGLHDRIASHQVKTSRDPQPFSVDTLMLGAERVFERMLTARRELEAGAPGVPVETVFVCDDYPRGDDRLSDAGREGSSAAFIRAHERRRSTWTLAEWRQSVFGDFVRRVQDASGLADAEFERAWRGMAFHPGGRGRVFGAWPAGPAAERRIAELAALLPRLVADASDQDRWTVDELFTRLGWRDAFLLRHEHAFPVDALYQTNDATQEALERALAVTRSGYLSLVGPPGSGKSTLLAAGLISTPNAQVVRYLAFLPTERHGLGRAEAFDFLSDLVRQFKQQGLGTKLMTGAELPELREQLQQVLAEAGDRFRAGGPRTVVVVDGLDHVPREENPEHSMLSELPQPHSLPDGVVFLLGTQKLDLEGLSPAVRDQAALPGRKVDVQPLSPQAVGVMAEVAGVPNDVDRGDLYARTEGHPLSTRYVVEGLLALPDAAARREWLRSGPSYGGDVNVFYERAWRDLERAPEARHALAYVALAEGPISTGMLDELASWRATDAAWEAAGHLLRRNRLGAWSVFHNSFRLFLRDRTGMRHGLPDEAAVRGRYRELAAAAGRAAEPDPQRWLELRYLARAGDHEAVAVLATPERFRTQFVEGRKPGDITDDIDFAFAAAGALRRPKLLVDLILARHETARRAEALGNEVITALIDLGNLEGARGLLATPDVSLSGGAGYRLVDAYLANGDAADARDLFLQLEPVDRLLGLEPIDFEPDLEPIACWAERALVFRKPGQFLDALEKLRTREDPFGGLDAGEVRRHLKLVAARGQVDRNPVLPIKELRETLQLAEADEMLLRGFAAAAAFDTGDDVLAERTLTELAAASGTLRRSQRRENASRALALGRRDLAEIFMAGVPRPALADADFEYVSKGAREAVRQVVLHARLAAELDLPAGEAERPKSALLAGFEARLAALGWLLGRLRVGELMEGDVPRETRAMLDLLQHGSGDSVHDNVRSRLDELMDDVVALVVDVAAAAGQQSLARTAREIDARLAADPGRIGSHAFRRAYALTIFARDGDLDAALERLPDASRQTESTPAEQIAEAARNASALIALGQRENAYTALAEMHRGGLGYSRAAKKDGQYLLWGEALARACIEDPEATGPRVAFFARLLEGMALTEGYDAAGRLCAELLRQAARAGPDWSRAVCDRVEAAGLVTWTDLASAMLEGAVAMAPELAEAAGMIFGRLVLPVCGEKDDGIYPALIAAAPAAQLQRLIHRAVEHLRVDGHPARRSDLLREVGRAAAARGRPVDEGPAESARALASAPAPTPDRSDDTSADAENLAAWEAVRVRTDEKTRWNDVRAFARLALTADYATAAAVYARYADLCEDERCIVAMARLAIREGLRSELRDHLVD